MKLLNCPQCGLPPEFHWRNYSFGACSGALKCPYDHYRVQDSYWAGGKDKAKQRLEEKWMALVGQNKKEVASE